MNVASVLRNPAFAAWFAASETTTVSSTKALLFLAGSAYFVIDADSGQWIGR
jgi:hypothetical protein